MLVSYYVLVLTAILSWVLFGRLSKSPTFWNIQCTTVYKIQHYENVQLYTFSPSI